MEDAFKSIKAYLYEKATSPLAGAFATSWLVLNYRVPVILLSDEHYSTSFAAIDQYFVRPLFGWPMDCAYLGRALYGVVFPAALALTYIYVYPRLAEPVYQHVLEKRQKLRELKQEAEKQRLLTQEESTELYARMERIRTDAESKNVDHANEIDALNSTIKKLNSDVSKLHDQPNVVTDEIESSVENWVDDTHGNEAPIEEYDEYIRRTISSAPDGEFTVADVFDTDRWSEFGEWDKAQLDGRLSKKIADREIDEVTYVGRRSDSKYSLFVKGAPAVDSNDLDSASGKYTTIEHPKDLVLSDEEIAVLSAISADQMNLLHRSKNISDQRIRLAQDRLLQFKLIDRGTVGFFARPEGREWLEFHELLD